MSAHNHNEKAKSATLAKTDVVIGNETDYARPAARVTTSDGVAETTN